ncbi:GNAT family N-acetyltransferase [Pseudoalteromonas sp. SMS1]|uniref:GNAT family N-acetyltransferase n=1 Tax=Pseudoalteromonas sp. SMS1 TaxID=2908894 RepID=UPI001F2C4337|nr:GNAT family N-acetyltransferase [Pseudoalteromonas sp. SMS1]MCF2856192.1 GNAT family N-acetyltransferase [Pseudoalteromonas sp. SMS1]
MNKEIVFCNLAEKPQYVPKIAMWYYREWCEQSGRYSLQEVTDKLESALKKGTLPINVIALQGGELLGTAELKLHEMEEYLQFEHWIGGVYVASKARGKSLAHRLVQFLIEHAKDKGIETLYLQTEDLTGGLYRKLGFEPMFEADSKGYRVLLMNVRL